MPSTPSALVIGGVPSNLVLPEGSRATHVDNDLHDICSRLRELDPNLRLALVEHVNGNAIWAVTEVDRTGTESLVFRVGPNCELEELDARVITKIEWIRRIPAQERLAQIERDIERERAAAAEARSEKLYEDMGSKFLSDLYKCGFVHDPNPRSMVPTNKTARRAGRRIT